MHTTGTSPAGASPPRVAPRKRNAGAPARATTFQRALTEGGDARIALDETGVNPYGCPPHPDDSLVELGSSTASVISRPGFAAAAVFHARLCADRRCYSDEVARVRRQILALSGASMVPGTELVLAASGTDVHLFAVHATAQHGGIVRAVMAEPAETGSGVPEALAGRHFATGTCRGRAVGRGTPVAGTSHTPSAVRLRQPDGTPRHIDDIDAEFASQVEQVVRSGDHCLLVLTDLSKTGLLAPSPECAQRLYKKHRGRLDVLVDACQLRLSAASLAAYLELGFMVAITGSKFMTGPAFCGALLLPPAVAQRVRGSSLVELQDYCARPEWPSAWPAAAEFDETANVGLLLRWEAALTEWASFSLVPRSFIHGYLMQWGHAVADRIASDPTFEALPVPTLDRGSRSPFDWDGLQTIFPFMVYRQASDGRRLPLSREETHAVYRRMQTACRVDEAGGSLVARYRLGQPVACGHRHGAPVSAVRICASARGISTAAHTAQGTVAAIEQAMSAFDKIAWLVRRLNRNEL